MSNPRKFGNRPGRKRAPDGAGTYMVGIFLAAAHDRLIEGAAAARGITRSEVVRSLLDEHRAELEAEARSAAS